MERRLSAILAADVVGYSKLMEQDEGGTFERLRGHRKQLFEPEIDKHHGRIFKLMGDGVMAEFGSVVDAVECAVSLQRGLTERNTALPEDQRIQVRIGVNLGEVIVEGDDRYGEGVNIAARLEQLADPGGIWVSDKVAREVEKKLAFGFEPMGAQQVKNIALPIQAYRVKLEGGSAQRLLPPTAKRRLSLAAAAAALALMIGGAALWYFPETTPTDTTTASRPRPTDTRPSLVVLPFTNLSDDKDQGYLADGITEDLTTELARVPGLFVISRNAAFTYKGKAMQPGQIAKELGVRYILEGSTRRAGGDMRLNAQLIDAETGGHIWAERFDGQWADVFALQDKVIASIAGALKLRLMTGQDEEIAGGTSNPDAYDAYLRGLELYTRGTPEDFVKAVASYQRALALDPDFGAVNAELAWIYWDLDDQRAKVLGLSWEKYEEIEAKTYEKPQSSGQTPFTVLLSAHRLLADSRAEVRRGHRRSAKGPRAQSKRSRDSCKPEPRVELQWTVRGRASLPGRGPAGRSRLE